MNADFDEIILQLKHWLGLDGAPSCNGGPYKWEIEARELANKVIPNKENGGCGGFIFTVLLCAIIITCIKYCD